MSAIPRTPGMVWAASVMLAAGSILPFGIAVGCFSVARNAWPTFFGGLIATTMATTMLGASYRAAVRPRSAAARVAATLGWVPALIGIPVWLLLWTLEYTHAIRRPNLSLPVSIAIWGMILVGVMVGSVNRPWASRLSEAEQRALESSGPDRDWAAQSPYRLSIRELLAFGLVVTLALGASQWIARSLSFSR